MTRIVPSASESGTFRRGFITSPAVKVMLFQASAEKSEFVCATQMPTKSPKAVAAVKPCPTSCKLPRSVQKSLKLVAAKTNRRDEIVRPRHPRNEHTRVARDADGDRRDRAGLDHEKKRPAVKE